MLFTMYVLYIYRLIMEGKGPEVVQTILKVSQSGRTIKQNALIYALAICARCHNAATKKAAYDVIKKVCRIPTYLFMFIKYCENESAGTGWGRLHRRSIADWYNSKDPQNLARLRTKFPRREGWSHKDVFRLCHIKPLKPAIAAVVVHTIKGLLEANQVLKDNLNDEAVREVLVYLEGVDKAKEIDKDNDPEKQKENVTTLVGLIEKFKLNREHVSNTMLSEKPVWQALLKTMPVGAMIRNLGNMTSKLVLEQGTAEEEFVLNTLGDQEKFKNARIHPFNLLVALKTYSRGMGEYGQLRWNTNPRIVDAIERAFYRSFKNIPATGKRFLLAVDVSGSMNVNLSQSPAVTARDAAAAMAMVTAQTEKDCKIIPFSHNAPTEIKLKPEDKLLDVQAKFMRYNFGRTDCSLPMKYAMEKRLEVDVFVVYTDSETYYGNTHPTYALKEYRRISGIHDARLIVVGMTSSGFSIADPEDKYMMDMVGFDSNAPQIIHQFVQDFQPTHPQEEDMET